MINRGERYDKYIDIFCIMFIGVVCIWNIGDISKLRIVDDGFVYWGIAATLFGYDWTDLLSVSQYYSFGYSFLLVPLFWLTRLGVSMTAIYRIAIVMNISFLVGSYFLCCSILRQLEIKMSETQIKLTSLFAICYIGNMVQINFAWTECWLVFLYWLIIYLLMKVCQKPGYINTFWLLLLTAYIFTVHMRAIGVVIAVGMVLCGYVWVNRTQTDRKWIIFAIAETVILLVVVVVTKEAITDHIYLGGKAVDSVNNIRANAGRLKSLLSISGLIDLGMSVLGKMFYAGTASFLTAVIGMFFALTFVVRSVVGGRIKGEKEVSCWIVLFTLLTFGGEIGVSAIFKSFRYYSADVTNTLGDTIIFGRYSDFVVGPMMVLGIYTICRFKKYYKEIIAAIFFLIVCAISVQKQFDILAFYGGSGNFGFRKHSAYWAAFLENGTIDNFAYRMLGISLMIGFVLLLGRMLTDSRKHVFAFVLGSICIFWGVCGITYSTEYINQKQNKAKSVDTVYHIINATDHNTSIYCCGEVVSGFFDVKVLQWMLGGRTIHICSMDDLDQIDLKNAIIVCDSGETQQEALLSDRLDYIYDSGTISVFVDSSNSYYDVLRDKAEEMSYIADTTVHKVNLQSVVTDYSFVKANGSMYYKYNAAEGAYMTGNMGTLLTDGTYEFQIDMRIRDCVNETEAGYVAVGTTDGEIQKIYKLLADDFANEERQKVTVQMKICGMQEPFVGIYTYGVASMRVYDISYQKIKGNIELEDDESVEMLSGIPKEMSICYVDSDGSGEEGFPHLQNRKINYLTGTMVTYKESFDDDYYLVEKNMEEVYSVFKNMKIRYENEKYVLYYNFL